MSICCFLKGPTVKVLPRGQMHRPATCAGVVAKGYSLALPEAAAQGSASWMLTA